MEDQEFKELQAKFNKEINAEVRNEVAMIDHEAYEKLQKQMRVLGMISEEDYLKDKASLYKSV